VSTPLSLQNPDLPRRNGELAFDAPWQSTVFALAAAVIEHAFGGDREPVARRERTTINVSWPEIRYRRCCRG
jgi:hypothetical protein